MQLAQAIHARWAADAALANLLPESRLITGAYVAGGPAIPYATLALRGGTSEGSANDRSAIDVVAVRIQVHHDDYDLGHAVADAVLAAFDRSDFALSDNDRVICMQRARPPQESQDPRSGQWTWLIDFHCRVSLAAAQP